METINFFTEPALKRIFCQHPTRIVLMDFLKAFLPEHLRITTAECIAAHPYRGSHYFLFDFLCLNEEKEMLVVELAFCCACYSKLRVFYYARRLRKKWRCFSKHAYLILITREDALADESNFAEEASTNYLFYKDHCTQKEYFQPIVSVVHLKQLLQEDSKKRNEERSWRMSARALEWCRFIHQKLDGDGERDDDRNLPEDFIFCLTMKSLDKNSFSAEELACVEEQSTDQEEFQAALHTARSQEAFRIAQKLREAGVEEHIIKKCTGYGKEKCASGYGMPSLHSNCFLMEENELAKVEVLC